MTKAQARHLRQLIDCRVNLECAYDKRSEHEGFGDEELTGKVMSWRGRYKEVALRRTEERYERGLGDAITPTQLLNILLDTVGKTFEGYKGGDFTMTRDTPIWISEYGVSNHNAIIGVNQDEYTVTIESKVMSS